MQKGLRSAAKQQPCIFCLLRVPTRSFLHSAAFHPLQRQRHSSKAARGTVSSSAEDEVSEYSRLLKSRYGHDSGENLGLAAAVRYSNDRALAKRRNTARDEHSIRAKLDHLSMLLENDPIISNIHLPKQHLVQSFRDFKQLVFSTILPLNSQDQLPPWLVSFAFRTKRIGPSKIHDDELRDAFIAHAIMSTFTDAEIEHQRSVADLSYPPEWFPGTRALRRKFHLHIGPTNSGKTYHALKRLQESASGYYAGPLRLLAHEIYMRLNAQGLRCNLVTGDDRRAADDDPEAGHTSCTVEMIPLNSRIVDVAVIDEIQMLADHDRGFAWTQAMLGVPAREVHLCGEERALPIVKQLVAMCGDELVVHKYNRLSPLEMMPESLFGDLRQLTKGDCVVCFQINTIHALRSLIEKTLHVKCAVIYGSLPPETRAQQAALFNDPNNDYDILLASDAVGMGLNLSIRRMIFHSTVKFSNASQRHESLKIHEIKQVAGRAGRFSTAQADIDNAKTQQFHQANQVGTSSSLLASDTQVDPVAPTPPSKQVGYVGCLEPMDFEILETSLESTAPPIEAAGIWPPSYLIDRFSKLFPLGSPFSFLMRRMLDIGKNNPRFFTCMKEPVLAAADAIEPVQGLSIYEKAIFSTAPAQTRAPDIAALLREYAECVADGKTRTILEIANLDLDLLAADYKPSHLYLKQIEQLHKGIVLHIWLAFRFPTVLLRNDLAIHVRGLCEKRIEDTLAALSFDLKSITARRKQSIQTQLKADLARISSFTGSNDDTRHEHLLAPPYSDEPLGMRKELRRERRQYEAQINPIKGKPNNSQPKVLPRILAAKTQQNVQNSPERNRQLNESMQISGQGPRIQYYSDPPVLNY